MNWHMAINAGETRPNTTDRTCLVDGDTLWLHGENIRLKDIDTP